MKQINFTMSLDAFHKRSSNLEALSKKFISSSLPLPQPHAAASYSNGNGDKDADDDDDDCHGLFYCLGLDSSVSVEGLTYSTWENTHKSKRRFQFQTNVRYVQFAASIFFYMTLTNSLCLPNTLCYNAHNQ